MPSLKTDELHWHYTYYSSETLNYFTSLKLSRLERKRKILATNYDCDPESKTIEKKKRHFFFFFFLKFPLSFLILKDNVLYTWLFTEYCVRILVLRRKPTNLTESHHMPNIVCFNVYFSGGYCLWLVLYSRRGRQIKLKNIVSWDLQV